MKKVVYVVPILTPYAIARFQVLAKEMGIDLHVIVEKSRTDERNGSGGSYQEIKDCHTYLLESREHGYQLWNTKSGYAINESRKYSFGLRALVKKIDPDIVIVCNSTQILFLAGPKKYKLGVVVEDTPRAEEGRRPLNRLVKRLLMGTADFYLPFNSDGGGRGACGLRQLSCHEGWHPVPSSRHALRRPGQRHSAHEFCRLHILPAASHRVRVVGGFDVNVKSCQDYDLWIRLIAEYPMAFVGEALVNYYYSEDSTFKSDNQKYIDGSFFLMEKYRQLYESHPDDYLYRLNSGALTGLLVKRDLHMYRAYKKTAFRYRPLSRYNFFMLPIKIIGKLKQKAERNHG